MAKESKKIYKARKGARGLTNNQAQIYGERIEKLMNKKKGKITPRDIIADAENLKSPFHSYFEWDDTEAGKLYRLQQARNLVASIVTVVVIKSKPMEHRSFFSVVNGKTKTVYVTLETATTKPNYRRQLINQIKSHLRNTINLLEMFEYYEK